MIARKLAQSRSWAVIACAPLAYVGLTTLGASPLREPAAEPSSVEYLSWPLGADGSIPRALYSTHGQYWKLGSADAYLHQGLDISACPREPVFAVEAGTVVHKSFASTGGDPQYQELIISRGSDFTHGIRYLHLGGSRVDVGDKVERDELIGTVVNWDVWCSYDHLHLQSYSYPERPASGVWNASYAKDDGNPIALFDPATDKELPFCNSITTTLPSGSAKILFFKNDTDTELDPADLSGSIDVVASLHDLCFSEHPVCSSTSSGCSDKSSFEVAPYQVTLKIRGPMPTAGETERATASVAEKDFDPIQLELAIGTDLECKLADIYYKSSSLGQYDQRDQRFVLTHGLYTSPGSWDPTPGTYEVSVEIQDRANNFLTISMNDVTVK